MSPIVTVTQLPSRAEQEKIQEKQQFKVAAVASLAPDAAETMSERGVRQMKTWTQVESAQAKKGSWGRNDCRDRDGTNAWEPEAEAPEQPVQKPRHHPRSRMNRKPV